MANESVFRMPRLPLFVLVYATLGYALAAEISVANEAEDSNILFRSLFVAQAEPGGVSAAGPGVQTGEDPAARPRAELTGGWKPGDPIIWILAIFVCALSGATFGLALYNHRLTRLRLGSDAGHVVSLEDSFLEWFKNLQEQWHSTNEKHQVNADKSAGHIEEIKTDFQNHVADFNKLFEQAFTRHHNIVTKELAAIASDLEKTRDILATVRQVAEEKKTELEEYKTGYRASVSKEALGHLCDVRDHLLNMITLISNNPNDPAKSIRGLEDIAWELEDTLNNLDLVAIEVKEGMHISDPKLSGRHKVLGTTPARKADDRGCVAEVVKPGYLIRIHRGTGSEEMLFRPVQVRVFGEAAQDEAPQPV